MFSCVERSKLLVIAQGEQALLFQGKGARHEIADVAYDSGELVFVPPGQTTIELGQVVFGVARESPNDETGGLRGSGVITLHDTCADIAERSALQTGEQGKCTTTVVGGVRMVRIHMRFHVFVSSVAD